MQGCVCLTKLCLPCRLKVSTVSPWSCGASWEATKGSELPSESFYVITLRITSLSGIRHVKSSLHRELVHLVKHICETFKAKKLDCILVIPPAVTR